MKSRTILLIALFLSFTVFVCYNYQKARQAIKETKPSRIEISFVNLSKTIKVGDKATISWQVDAPEDFRTQFTGLYYDTVSTPSAVTTTDSPAALSYELFTPDYMNGTFFLPDTFESTISFPKAGKYFIRAYAKVTGNHLWTEERVLEVLP